MCQFRLSLSNVCIINFLLLLLLLNGNIVQVRCGEEESAIGKTSEGMEEAEEFDASGCGLTKGCLMKPPNCTPHKDCAYAMSYTADTERIYFELLGQVQAERNSYVALGFSVDGLMGGDTVTDCSSFEGAPFKARLSYNPGKSNRKVPLDVDQEAQILRTHTAVYADGTVYCRFSQLIQPPGWVQPQFVRHFGTPIFILMSSSNTRGKELTIHSLNTDAVSFPYSSPTPVQLTQYTLAATSPPAAQTPNPTIVAAVTAPPPRGDEVSKMDMGKMMEEDCGGTQPNSDGGGGADYSRAQTKAHGLLMLLSWLLLVPFAILCARFIHHEPFQLFGLHIWFQIHRFANSLAFLFVFVSFVCIFSASDGLWIGPSIGKGAEENFSARSVHALLGALSICLTILQPLNALFRCAPNSPARFIFYWLHSIIGYSAWLFSVIAICIACFCFDNYFLNWFIARDLLIASLALIIVCFSILQIVSYRRKKQQQRQREEEGNTGRRGGGGNAVGIAAIGGGDQFGTNAKRGSTLFQIRNGPENGNGNDGEHKESLLIQRAIVGLFLALASTLCVALCAMLLLG